MHIAAHASTLKVGEKKKNSCQLHANLLSLVGSKALLGLSTFGRDSMGRHFPSLRAAPRDPSLQRLAAFAYRKSSPQRANKSFAPTKSEKGPFLAWRTFSPAGRRQAEPDWKCSHNERWSTTERNFEPNMCSTVALSQSYQCRHNEADDAI